MIEGAKEIIIRPVGDLLPYVRNARTHSEAQVAQIAASIKEFGFCNPILTRGDSIVAGHGRLLAARKLGLDEVPTVDLSHLTKTQARAYVLADNQLATNAGWDTEMLAGELTDLKDDGFDLDMLGFSQSELNKLFGDSEYQEQENAGDQTGEIDEKFCVLVTCKDENDQANLLFRLTEEGFQCRSLIS